VPQIHLRAEPGDYAPIVLLPGDPNRATAIAAHFDGGVESSRRVNDHRLLYGYSGTYHGVPVSVQTTGMGTPSLAIVVEELLRLGARTLIRVGTCGGIGRGIRTGDLVIAASAVPGDGTTATYLRGDPYAPTADFALVRALADAAARGGTRWSVGTVLTLDSFYDETPADIAKWRSRNVLAFEMESSALFYLAARAWAAGQDVRAGAILTVSDVLTEEMGAEESYLPLEELDRRVEAMIDVALETVIALAV
jgi:DeoD family purine-nucleoside phosphorylase